MSCYRCGKELPPGQVECEDDCTLSTSGDGQRLPTFAEAAAAKDLPACRSLCLVIELHLDPAKVAADPAGHHAAVLKFSRLLGEILVNSGISDFIKTK